jgi:spore coat polysaccharide biosynthesis protein SpsF
MNIGIVILSRYSSSRLPGKALMKIQDKTVLDYIIERLLQVVTRDQMVLATSSEPSDDPIAAFARSRNIHCHRGSLENVAERFYNAAKERKWEYAIRINGDNIFVDILLLKKMVGFAQSESYDFISNVKDRTFPKGMSIEIARVAYYAQHLETINASPYFREHVMVYLYNEPNGKKFYVQNHELPEAAGIQFALDTAEDYKRTSEIISHFDKPHWEYNLMEIFKIYKSENYV